MGGPTRGRGPPPSRSGMRTCGLQPALERPHMQPTPTQPHPPPYPAAFSRIRPILRRLSPLRSRSLCPRGARTRPPPPLPPLWRTHTTLTPQAPRVASRRGVGGDPRDRRHWRRALRAAQRGNALPVGQLLCRRLRAAWGRGGSVPAGRRSLPMSPHVSPYLPRSAHVSPCLPMSPHVSPCLPMSPHVSPYVSSPQVCPGLPRSPKVSQGLPRSAHVSPGARRTSLASRRRWRCWRRGF